jgi:2-polyprenyl-3-methyl-5-hydroxy-6-metoxy-1,4-benzoquinol methylase
MERLAFTLPDFTRLLWVSDAARDVWAPRLSRITKAWLEIEWRTVAASVRPCGVTVASPQGFLALAATWAESGLGGLPVEIQGVNGSSYSSTSVPVEAGKPFVFRFVVGRPSDVLTFKRAWDAGDQASIGGLLGYPACCYRFFRRVWVEQGLVDTTWPMGVATASPVNGAREVAVTGPPEANILWRWMGARAVPHLPCRFDCESTVALAHQFLAVGRAAGFDAEMDWLLEILRWPVEWSALHGIAEIRTPVLKVSTRTDATSHKYVVRREGDAYPREGARGLGFPYRSPARPLLTTTPSFRRGLEHPIPLVTADPPGAPDPAWYASDNGFPSRAGMEAAHRPVVELVAATLGDTGGPVLDLGCGNGALLRAIRDASPAVLPFGIDLDPTRIAHAREVHGSCADHFVTGDVFESEEIWVDGRRYALALLMPGRLLEAGPERAARLRTRLRTACDRVLVYAYGDWLMRHGGLRGLAEAAGIRLTGTGPVEMAALAEEL